MAQRRGANEAPDGGSGCVKPFTISEAVDTQVAHLLYLVAENTYETLRPGSLIESGILLIGGCDSMPSGDVADV